MFSKKMKPTQASVQLKKLVIGRVGVFIDAANIFYSQQTLGWKADYHKLKSYITSEASPAGFFYYTGKVGSLEKQLRFIKRLKKSGARRLLRFDYA